MTSEECFARQLGIWIVHLLVTLALLAGAWVIIEQAHQQSDLAGGTQVHMH